LHRRSDKRKRDEQIAKRKDFMKLAKMEKAASVIALYWRREFKHRTTHSIVKNFAALRIDKLLLSDIRCGIDKRLTSESKY
jgi:hypothetical protein